MIYVFLGLLVIWGAIVLLSEPKPDKITVINVDNIIDIENESVFIDLKTSDLVLGYYKNNVPTREGFYDQNNEYKYLGEL